MIMPFPIIESISIGIGSLGVIYSAIQTKYAKEQAKVAKMQKLKSEELFSKYDEALENSVEVTSKISDILLAQCATLDIITVQNFGLDLETVMPWLKNKLLLEHKLLGCKLVYQGLIANHESEVLLPLINGTSNIKTTYINASLESAGELTELDIRNIDVEIRAYDTPPIFHGFIINEKHLFISFTEIQLGKIKGGVFPYMYMQYDKTSKLNQHYFRMFKSWFVHIWDKSVLRVKVIQ
jgi:hypothetical protein